MVNDLLSTVRTNSNEVEWAVTIALPPALMRTWLTKSTGLERRHVEHSGYIRKNNIHSSENSGAELRIVSANELATAGAGGTAWSPTADKEVLRGHLPLPRKVLCGPASRR